MTSSTTIRIDSRQRDLLRRLADQRHSTMIATLDAALEALRRQDFFEAMANAEQELKARPDDWAAYQAEARPWLDAT